MSVLGEDFGYLEEAATEDYVSQLLEERAAKNDDRVVEYDDDYPDGWLYV